MIDKLVFYYRKNQESYPRIQLEIDWFSLQDWEPDYLTFEKSHYHFRDLAFGDVHSIRAILFR